mmetsp:Transcript_12359/g.24411  ORF Transcript_12359/g.24411 Transcript_12359/m.24411 type:complete len:181 (-) Transcript_12359:1037-1579(-)
MSVLNARVKEVSRYHATVDAMELAYVTRGAPKMFQACRVEVDEQDGDELLRSQVSFSGGGAANGGGAGGAGGGGLSGSPQFGNGGGQSSSLLVYTEKRRVRVPLHDSFFAEPIKGVLKEGFQGWVELHGVLVGGRQRLRVRLPSLLEAQQAEHRGETLKAGGAVIGGGGGGGGESWQPRR